MASPPTKFGINKHNRSGGDNFCTFHQQLHSEKKCPQWLHSMTLVMNRLLDPKLTKDSGQEENKNQIIEKQDIDNMFSWNGVSLFDTEESTLKTECTPTVKKDIDLTISKIKILQKNVKRQVEVNVEDKTPRANTLNQEAGPLIETAKPIEEQIGVNEGNTNEIGELEEDIPTQNQPGEEDIELGWEEKVDTPPFLLTLEMLNHNVHNCLVDSGSAVNVMPLEICKKINGQPESTFCEVTQLDSTGVKVVGEMKNVLIRLSTNNTICQFIDITMADIPSGYGLILN